jgi:hypothetical protein
MLPSWVLVLEAAEEGSPFAREIIEGEDRIIWWERWKYYRNAKAAAQKKQAEKANR